MCVGQMSQPIYVCCVLGYASFTASLAGLAFYAPMFIQEYRPCDPAWDFEQASADFVFGVRPLPAPQPRPLLTPSP